MRFCSQGPSLAIHTPAKLNLFLEVLGRRPDGYHELETVMVSIGLYDTLLFSEDGSHQTRLECHPTGLPSRQQIALTGGPDNLVSRAAELLRQQTGCERGVRIDLWKRIPIEAGLGGGSSDAAATLVGLNRFWNLGLSSGQLHRLAARLGSDVNFFLDSAPAAVCTSRGEQLEPLAVPQRLHFVVVCPASGLSTADVFGRWQQATTAPQSLAAFTAAMASGQLSSRHDLLHNALESPARTLNANVGRTLDRLRQAGVRPVLMSGSGTSCFGLCRTARHARTLAGRLRQQCGQRVFALSSGA